MTHAQDVLSELRQLIASGRISEESLATITGIPPEKLSELLGETHRGTEVMTTDATPLTVGENARISVLTGLLTHVAEFDDDERLQAILESLTVECHLTLENIARLTRVDIEDLKRVLDDPGSVSTVTKYTIALRSSYLISAANLARPR